MFDVVCVCGGLGAADFLAVSYLQHVFFTHTTTVPIFSFLFFIDNISRLMMSAFFFRLRARNPEIHHSVVKHKFIKNIYSLITKIAKRLNIGPDRTDSLMMLMRRQPNLLY